VAEAKIPALRLAAQAYLDLAANWRGLVQVGAPWLVVPWVMHALGGGGLLALLGDLALIAGINAIEVAWHRRLLLGEPLPARYAPLNPLVARYLSLWVVIVLVAVAPAMTLALLVAASLGLGGAGAEGAAAAPEGPGLALSALLIAAAVASVVAAMRLQLVLPAAAVGEAAFTFGSSWRATRGNGLRLLAGVLMVSLPPALAGTLLAFLLDGLAESTGSLVLGWLTSLAPIAAAWVQAPLLAAFLSYAYLLLRDGSGGGAGGGDLRPQV
jgi:hypothetical protein